MTRTQVVHYFPYLETSECIFIIIHSLNKPKIKWELVFLEFLFLSFNDLWNPGVSWIFYRFIFESFQIFFFYQFDDASMEKKSIRGANQSCSLFISLHDCNWKQETTLLETEFIQKINSESESKLIHQISSTLISVHC